MTNLLMSKFETYLLDEETGLESKDEQVQIEKKDEVKIQEVFPPGFFTSL